jgi:serine/threonine protein kinase
VPWGFRTEKVIDFLQGRLAADACLSAAKVEGEFTEAHTYIGFDGAQRGRLLAEVCNARTVSHPNVYRVYDIGEWPGPALSERPSVNSGRPEALECRSESKGRAFLTMEYIDGEDLASLLRRIGRLPAPKAPDVARQLCAGLAAAHDKGVLHGDLTPK